MSMINIDDKALIIKDFLPKELFERIVSKTEYLNTLNYKKEYSKDIWEKALFIDQYNNDTQNNIEIIKNLYTKNLEEEIFKDKIFKDIADFIFENKNIPTNDSKSSLILNYYEYKKYSGINWHEDASYSLNLSLYVHTLWDNNWGGETLIDTGRGLPLASYPEPNSVLIIKNEIPHKVCSVMVNKTRKVIQGRIRFYE